MIFSEVTEKDYVESEVPRTWQWPSESSNCARLRGYLSNIRVLV